MMQITILIDNLCHAGNYGVEHGLGMYISSDTFSLLFDLGQSNAIFKNAHKMGIDIANADAVVVSHGHYDHTGGLKEFLKINAKAKVFMSSHAVRPKYKLSKYIGIPDVDKLDHTRFELSSGKLKLTEGLFLYNPIDITYPEDTKFNNFFRESGGFREPDSFMDECVLVFENEEDVSIVTACSHRGIKNIVESVESTFSKSINAIVGGFHLSNLPPATAIDLADFLNIKKVQILYTNHCTGYHQYEILKQHFKGITHYASTGTKINLT